eukprot:763772-Hanusia_phi.AAC.2
MFSTRFDDPIVFVYMYNVSSPWTRTWESEHDSPLSLRPKGKEGEGEKWEERSIKLTQLVSRRIQPLARSVSTTFKPQEGEIRQEAAQENRAHARGGGFQPVPKGEDEPRPPKPPKPAPVL